VAAVGLADRAEGAVVSGQAVHRVCTHGPEDHELFRLLVVVADFADATGRGAPVGQRVLAERVKVSKTTVHRLLERAVRDGWLVVETPGGPRRRAVYNLGPLLSYGPVMVQKWTAAVQAEYENGPDTVQKSAQDGPQTLNGFGRSSSRRPPARDGRATAVESQPPPVPLDPPHRPAAGTWRPTIAVASQDAIDACAYCDSQGWLTWPDGSVGRCSHRMRRAVTDLTVDDVLDESQRQP